MLPFVLLIVLSPDAGVPLTAPEGVDREELAHVAAPRDKETGALADLRRLLALPVTCCTILALSLFVGAIGSLSFYGRRCLFKVVGYFRRAVQAHFDGGFLLTPTSFRQLA